MVHRLIVVGSSASEGLFFMKVRIRKLPNSIDRWKDDFNGIGLVLCAFAPPKNHVGLVFNFGSRIRILAVCTSLGNVNDRQVEGWI